MPLSYKTAANSSSNDSIPLSAYNRFVQERRSALSQADSSLTSSQAFALAKEEWRRPDAQQALKRQINREQEQARDEWKSRQPGYKHSAKDVIHHDCYDGGNDSDEGEAWFHRAPGTTRHHTKETLAELVARPPEMDEVEPAPKRRRTTQESGDERAEEPARLPRTATAGGSSASAAALTCHTEGLISSAVSSQPRRSGSRRKAEVICCFCGDALPFDADRLFRRPTLSTLAESRSLCKRCAMTLTDGLGPADESSHGAAPAAVALDAALVRLGLGDPSRLGDPSASDGACITGAARAAGAAGVDGGRTPFQRSALRTRLDRCDKRVDREVRAVVESLIKRLVEPTHGAARSSAPAVQLPSMQTKQLIVTVTPGMVPGQRIAVLEPGTPSPRRFEITLPPNAYPGMKLQIVVHVPAPFPVAGFNLNLPPKPKLPPLSEEALRTLEVSRTLDQLVRRVELAHEQELARALAVERMRALEAQRLAAEAARRAQLEFRHWQVSATDDDL